VAAPKLSVRSRDLNVGLEIAPDSVFASCSSFDLSLYIDKENREFERIRKAEKPQVSIPTVKNIEYMHSAKNICIPHNPQQQGT